MYCFFSFFYWLLEGKTAGEEKEDVSYIKAKLKKNRSLLPLSLSKPQFSIYSSI